MKKYAGITLDKISINVDVLNDVRQTFIENLEMKLYDVLKDPKCSPSTKNLLKYMQKESVLKHLDNYLKLKEYEKIVECFKINFTSNHCNMVRLINRAVEHAPDDWNIKSRIHADAKFLHEYHTVDAELITGFEYLPEVERQMRQDYLDAMRTNLNVAFDKLKDISKTAVKVEDHEILALIFSMQIVHYINFISYLRQHDYEENINLRMFFMIVINELDASLGELSKLPSDSPKFTKQQETSKPKEALTFSNWLSKFSGDCVVFRPKSSYTAKPF